MLGTHVRRGFAPPSSRPILQGLALGSAFGQKTCAGKAQPEGTARYQILIRTGEAEPRLTSGGTAVDENLLFSVQLAEATGVEPAHANARRFSKPLPYL
jgi:hypothetical protein